MVGVVELDGRSVFVNEVIDVRESGGPESRLVPHGVEVVGDPVTPWLAERDEPWCDPEVETHSDDW